MERKNAGGKTAPEVRAMFARVARRYDFLNHLLSLGRDTWWRQAAAREAEGLGASDVLVDLCTGTGDLAFALHRAAPEARVVGLDFTPEMLALALRKAARRGIRAQGPPVPGGGAESPAGPGVGAGDVQVPGTLLFAPGDALAVPCADNSAALCSVAFGLRNVADTERALREMLRVVRPGGKLLLLEFTRPRGRFLGPLYMFYFRHVLPLLGWLLSAGVGDAYRYLPASVEAFAGPEEMTARLAKAGLREVRAVPLTFGAVHLYVGVK